MRKFKATLNIGFSGEMQEAIFEVSDNATENEIYLAAQGAVQDYIDIGYEEIEE